MAHAQPTTRVVNGGNLALSLITLLLAFLISLFSLSPAGRHLLFGRAMTSDEQESSPLELFLAESRLQGWHSAREAYFALDVANFVRIPLPGAASNFSVVTVDPSSHARTSDVFEMLFQPPSSSTPGRVPLGTLYRHVFLQDRFTPVASEDVKNGSTTPSTLNVLVVCFPSGCPMVTTLLGFQRLSRRRAARPLALFAAVVGMASNATFAVEREWRANGVFTSETTLNSKGMLQSFTLVGALPPHLQHLARQDSEERLYGVNKRHTHGATYQKATKADATALMEPVTINPFSDVYFSLHRVLSETALDVVHLDVDNDLSVASLTFLVGLANNTVWPPSVTLPKLIVVPMYVSEWADLILDAVVDLVTTCGYQLHTGEAGIFEGNPLQRLAELRAELRSRWLGPLRAYWTGNPPLFHFLLAQPNMSDRLNEYVRSSSPLMKESFAGVADDFFLYDPNETAPDTPTTVMDVYPFKDDTGAVAGVPDTAGEMGGRLYTFIVVLAPFALYSVPVIICVVLLRNLSKRWH